MSAKTIAESLNFFEPWFLNLTNVDKSYQLCIMNLKSILDFEPIILPLQEFYHLRKILACGNSTMYKNLSPLCL